MASSGKKSIYQTVKIAKVMLPDTPLLKFKLMGNWMTFYIYTFRIMWQHFLLKPVINEIHEFINVNFLQKIQNTV